MTIYKYLFLIVITAILSSRFTTGYSNVLTIKSSYRYSSPTSFTEKCFFVPDNLESKSVKSHNEHNNSSTKYIIKNKRFYGTEDTFKTIPQSSSRIEFSVKSILVNSEINCAGELPSKHNPTLRL